MGMFDDLIPDQPASSPRRIGTAEQLDRDRIAAEMRRAELARATGPARQVLAREVAASEASVNSGDPWINGRKRGDPLPSVVLGGTTRTAQAAPAPALSFDDLIPQAAPAPIKAPEKSGARSMAEGALRGAAGIGETILGPVVRMAESVKDSQAQKGNYLTSAALGYLADIPKSAGWLDAENADSTAYKVGKVGAQIAATLPVGGVLGAGIKSAAGGARLAAAAPRTAAALQAIGNAAQTGGLSAGGVKGAAGLGARAAGGALAGGAAAGLTGGDEQDAAQAAFIGGMLPVGFGAVGKGAALATGLVKPFTGKGQAQITGDILRQYANNPDAALGALRGLQQLVPGSTPITAAAAGDVGLSGLTRTMQAANPQMASELALRATAQNSARTGLLESIAGNHGTISVAKDARKAATDPLRESVLSAAGKIDAKGILSSLDEFLANPNNAGQTARQALERVRGQVSQVAGDTGAIDARALYEIRKDIGLAMNGKLQGEAGNLRYAKGVLDRVQSVFDDAIGSAAAKTSGEGGAVVTQGAEGAAADPWRRYLSTYAEHSKPINQMEQLQEVLKRVQTGTVDANGDYIISAAKLNNVLKNDSGELSKLLNPEQMQALRNVQADLNAARLGLESGKALGSNTAQNISQTWLLNRVLGRYGESPVVSSIMKKPLGLLYGNANEQITDQLTRALMDPAQARALLEQAVRRAEPRSIVPRAGSAAVVRGLLSDR
jgi:hypothetical protein